MTRRPTALGLLVLAVLAAPPAAALLAPRASGADPDLARLRSQRESRRAREQSLAADVARLSRIEARVTAQLATLQSRIAEVQADLDADRVRLAAVQAALRAQRVRLVALRDRLARSRRVLARRLVAFYEVPSQDLVTVALSARSFSELIDRGRFLQAIAAQDRRIIDAVRAARQATAVAVGRLAAQEARQQRVIAAVTSRRDALAGMRAAVSTRRATLTRARALRTAALRTVRADRRRVEARIASLERASVGAGGAGVGASSGGPWAIPWPIVQCESGGQNLPPNSAGASGYYQILASTWRLYGGSGPAAYLASKAEQDRVATRIWQGSGPSAWVCAGLVGL